MKKQKENLTMKELFKTIKYFAMTFVFLMLVVADSRTVFAEEYTNITRENATPIEIGKTVSINVNKSNDHFYYKFTVPENINQWVNISLTNYSSDYMELYLSNEKREGLSRLTAISKNEIDDIRVGIDGAAYKSSSSIVTLTPGETYYIEICGMFNEYIANCVLSVSSTPDDNWGTFDKAEALTCNQTKTGKIEYKDDIDCYAITLPNDGAQHNFILNANQNLYALFADANGIKISDTDVNANITNNSFSATGTGQKIYIRVEADYGVSSANYSIKVISEEKKISTETSGEEKKISTLKLTSYKKNSKKIVGKTISNAAVKLTAGKKTYKVKSNKSGKFTVKLKKKLKSKDKIKVTVTKANYKTITKTFKVK